MLSRRNFLKLGLGAGLGLMLPTTVFAAQPQVRRGLNPTPPPPGDPMSKMNRMSNTDRRLAAKRAAVHRKASGPTRMAMNPGGTPDYFGATPNWALSPLPPLVTFTGGAGSGAQAAVTVQAGIVTSLLLTDPGSGYTSIPTVGFDAYDGTGAAASATVNVTLGAVTSVKIQSSGKGYTSAPSVVFNDLTPGGSGATANATILNGMVASITVTASGSGYTPDATITLLGGGGTGAMAAPVVNGLTGLTLSAGGTGYQGIRKFVHKLAGLTAANKNDLNNYIPIGIPDTTTYPNQDYYEIELGQFTQQLHKDLPATTFRGYRQTNTTDATVSGFHYLGPQILASRDRAVRIKFTNKLGHTGAGGDLFLPVDTTIMGAGMGPMGEITAIDVLTGGSNYTSAPVVKITGGGGSGATAIAVIDAVAKRLVNIQITNPGSNYTAAPTVTLTGGGGTGATFKVSFSDAMGGTYAQNRATLHLHGGVTPWISDGTAHQWLTPAGEATPYPKGVGVYNVPDMAPAGDGSLTFFYTNQQSARLMFYHDHAYGITRLNVYAGEAAGYLLTDSAEQKLITGGTVNFKKADGTPGSAVIPAGTIPSLADTIPLIVQDKTFVPGPNQMAALDPTWNWGTTPGAVHTGDLWFPHVYMPNQNPADTMGVNAMGRWDYGPWFWPPFTGLVNGPLPNPLVGTSPEQGPVNPGTPNPTLVPESFMDTMLVNGTIYPFLPVQQKPYRLRILNACNDRYINLQLYYAKSNGNLWDANGNLLDPNAGEVNMVPAVPHAGLPATWSTDGREGGVPDPLAAGPAMIQIGTEGGLLPAVAVLPNTPIGYEYDRRSITVLNVSNKTLFLGPAERADVIIDFSGCPAGSKLILYNDAPAPVPAFDSRIDYYTGDPDQRDTGGAPTTQPGYGPNTRTLMQIQVVASTPVPFNLATLQAALPAVYAASQPAPVIPEAGYNQAFAATSADTYSRIQDTSLTFTPYQAAAAMTVGMLPKAIQELFEPNYGRMNAILGVEVPNTTMVNQTTIPFFYVDPETEIFKMPDGATTQPLNVLNDGTQIWKITHNGVDTHAIHFHMVNMQLINRVGWDGMVKHPDANELGWKETIRMHPLEDIIVATRPIIPTLPFKMPNSYRAMDVTMGLGSTMGFSGIDTNNNPVTVTNAVVNYGWEYVWHCHLLGHEENDMMRPLSVAIAPDAPTNLTGSLVTSGGTRQVNMSWVNTAVNATGLVIQRATDINFTAGLTSFNVGSTVTTYSDKTVANNTSYYYRIQAVNVVGSLVNGYPSVNSVSAFSNILSMGAPAAPTNVVITQPVVGVALVRVAWMDNASNETTFTVQRATNVNGPWTSDSTTVPAATGTGLTVTYNDNRVKIGTGYYFRVLAVNAFGSTASLTSARFLVA